MSSLEFQPNNKSTDDFLMRMKDKLIFASLKNYKAGFVIAPISIDAKINTSNQKEIGFSARLRLLNNTLDYILFSAESFETLGITENLFKLFSKINSEFCSSADKFNIK